MLKGARKDIPTVTATGAWLRPLPAGVEVTLGEFDGRLVVIGARDPAGFELCGDAQASCHFVRAQLGDGGVMRLEDSQPEKTRRVRFCWADAPLCNLFDTEGLPVGPFELEIP